jgi:hypothetical protein
MRRPNVDVRLTAGKNPLFVLDATQTASTRVKYEAPQAIFLWRRLNGGTWTREDLVDAARTAEDFVRLEKEGVRTTPDMKAGEFVEYGMLAESGDPNTESVRFLAQVVIDVLLNPSRLATPGPDDGLFPGGTFVRQRISTTEPTRLRMQVGREPPISDSNGFPRLPNVLAEVTSATAATHDVDAKPLVPGTGYVVLTVLLAASGAWQAISQEIDTKRRKVTLQFKNFQVRDDSDEGIHGEGDDAEVYLRVYDGTTLVKNLKWGPGQISDRPSNDVVDVSYPDVVVGPDPLDGIDPGVGVGLYALERDYFVWFPSTDEAQYNDLHSRPYEKRFIKYLTFPVGRGSETVSPGTTKTNFDITATRMNDDGHLWITANVRYVVAYE